MKALLILLSGLLLVSCGNKSLFDFDSIDYYQTDVPPDSVINIRMHYKMDKPSPQQNFALTYSANYPQSLIDTAFYKTLDTYYQKVNIDASKYDSIRNEIFVKISLDSYEERACISEFRDVLIFKKEGKVTGIAKVCFHCRQSYFVGSSSQSNFVTDEQYYKLKRILKPEEKK